MNPGSDSSQNRLERMLIDAVFKVVSALVRLVVRQGMAYPQLLEMLKKAYVQQVKAELIDKGEKCTQSRISLISGVHRKDVKRILEVDDKDTPFSSEKTSLTARLLSVWMGDPNFLDERGHPRPLPRQHQDPAHPSFEMLVRSISQDVRPRTVIDEWLQRGLVSQDDNQLWVLNQDALFPSGDLEAKLAYFARNTADHIASCDHNLHHSEQSFPERSLFFNKLSVESVDELEALSRAMSQEMLLALNKEAMRLAARDDAQGGGQERFIQGVYFYREHEPQ